MINKKLTNNILLAVVSFLIGRVVIFDSLNPIAISFLSRLSFTYNFYLSGFFMMLGMFTKLEGMFLLKYVLCFFIMLLINVIMGNTKENMPLLSILTGSFATLLSSVAVSFFQGFSPYYFVLAFLETALCFLLTYILKDLQRDKIFTKEGVLSLSVLISAILVGSCDIYIFGTSFLYAILTFICLNIIFKSDGFVATSFMAVFCGVLNLSGVMESREILPFVIAPLFLSKIENKKTLSIVYFITVYVLRSVFLIDFVQREYLLPTFVSSVIFALMPMEIYGDIKRVFNVEKINRENYMESIKSICNIRLKSFSNSFRAMAKTFEMLAVTQAEPDNEQILDLTHEVMRRTCVKCEKLGLCLKDLDGMEREIAYIINCYENGEEAKKQGQCVDYERLFLNTKYVYDLYKTEVFWQNKLFETRRLISRQLNGICAIIDDLAEDLNFNNYDNNLTNTLTEKLREKMEVDDLIIYTNSNKKKEIMMDIRPCEDKNFCNEVILDIVREVTKIEFSKACYGCIINKDNRKQTCKLKLIEKCKYKITTGVARRIRDNSEVSGDSYSIMEVMYGKYLIALSDGMGSGEKAKEESAASIELYEQFSTTNFSKDICLDMINSVMTMKSSEDNYASLDILNLDLYDGIGEFIKIGSAPSYVYSDKKVEIIKSSSLPVGILDEITPQKSEVILKRGDIIVMVTDGITEISGYNELWVRDLILNYESTNPQQIADYILEMAVKLSHNNIKDDMSVVCCRIW